MCKIEKTNDKRHYSPLVRLFVVVLASVLTISGTFAQNRNQIINIDAADITVKELLSQIEQQSKYSFAYKDADLDTTQRISLKASGTVEQLIKKAFPQLKMRFENRMIVLLPATAQQQKSKNIVNGLVMTLNGEAIVGATIVVKGNEAVGTISTEGGNFQIEAAPGTVLLASYLGYRDEEVTVGQRGAVVIRMTEDSTAIDAVVVVGYGVQRKATLTGSVTMTTGESLQQNSSVNLSQGMAGRVSGVIVSNRSGEPGADDAVMYIRGRSTLGDNSPLIIIDGIAGRDEEFSRLSGDEISSVTVLKDASASIYGARSANGVILVTTRRGEKNNAPRITFNYDLGLQQPTRMVEMADAVLYTTSYNAALAIEGGTPHYNEQEIEAYRTGSDLVRYPNTNWLDAIVKPYSAQHKYGVSINGGTEHVSYFVSVNGQYQDGIYVKSATNYNQYNIRSNVDVQVTNRFRIGFDISARQQHKNYSAFPSDDYGIFYTAIRMKPTGQPYFPNGLLTAGANPAIMVQDVTGYDRRTINTVNTTLTANWDLGAITKGLSIDAHVAYDIWNQFRKNWKTPWIGYSYNQVTEQYEPRSYQDWPTASLREWYAATSNLTVNAMLNYQRKFGDHNVSVMLGFEQNSYRYDTFNTQRKQFGSSAIDELFAGDPDVNYFTNDGTAAETARRSYFSRVGYDFAGKYMLQAIFRYDGSENFPKNNRWGFFPGFSAGWRISEEQFVKDAMPWLTNLKLRGSYGTQGNDKVSAFQYMTTYEFSSSSVRYAYQLGGHNVSVVIPGTVPNTAITWEVAKTWNIGLDGEINGGLLSWEAEVFKTRRENILCSRNASVPNYTGLTKLPAENIGIVENQGFEMQLAHSGRSTNRELSYRISGNFMYARNRIIYMDETPWPEGHDYMKLEGKPMGSSLYYIVDGVYKSQYELDSTPHLKGSTLGDFIYRDVDGDGEITNLDRVRGEQSSIPQIVYGASFSAQWRNFDFMMLLQGQAMAKFYYSPLTDPLSTNVDKKAAENAWTLDNPDSNYPRLLSTRSNGGVYRNTFYYKDASFLRLKNLEIGYNLSSPRLKQMMGIANLRVYVGGYNLLTFDSLKVVDPETSDEETQNYPQMKVFNMGIKITF